MIKYTNRWLILLLGLSLLLRLGFLAWGTMPGGMVQDGGHYDLLAKSLLHDGTFPSAYRSPGYPVFLAAMYKIFGETPTPIFVFQALLSTLSVWLLFLISREILGKERTGYALITAALVGLNPEIAAYSVVLLREAMTFFLLLLATWLCLRMFTRDWRYGIGLGFTVAGLAYVRQEACLLIFVMMAGGLLRSQWRQRAFIGGSIAALLIAACTLPWVIYCGSHRGYANMQSALNSNLFCRTWYFSPSGTVEPELRQHIINVVAQNHLSAEQIKRYVIPPLLVAELPPGDVLAEASLYEKLGRIARENLQNNPRQYFLDTLHTLKATMGGYWLAWWPAYWNAPPFSENIRQGQWWVAIIKIGNRLIWPMAVLSLGILGSIGGWRNHDEFAWPITLILIGTIISLSTAILLVQGDPRLRQAYDGFFYLGMMCGLSVLVSKATRRA